jgi:hypothetical protein
MDKTFSSSCIEMSVNLADITQSKRCVLTDKMLVILYLIESQTRFDKYLFYDLLNKNI